MSGHDIETACVCVSPYLKSWVKISALVKTSLDNGRLGVFFTTYQVQVDDNEAVFTAFAVIDGSSVKLRRKARELFPPRI